MRRGNTVNNNLARIAIVLDRSGSMASIREAAISGFNEFIGQLRAAPGAVTLKLVQFDDQYETVLDKPLSEVPTLTAEMFVPRGTTALLDAQGRTIIELGEELRNLPESDRPGKVIVMTMTDGMENASHQYTYARIAAMIAHQRDVYSWEFMYLGANQDAIRVAAGMGIPLNSAMTFAANNVGVANTMQASADYVNAVRFQSRMGAPAPASFSDKDREAAMADADDPAVQSR
jgi:hypothetical protein